MQYLREGLFAKPDLLELRRSLKILPCTNSVSSLFLARPIFNYADCRLPPADCRLPPRSNNGGHFCGIIRQLATSRGCRKETSSRTFSSVEKRPRKHSLGPRKKIPQINSVPCFSSLCVVVLSSSDQSKEKKNGAESHLFFANFLSPNLGTDLLACMVTQQQMWHTVNIILSTLVAIIICCCCWLYWGQTRNAHLGMECMPILLFFFRGQNNLSKLTVGL